jgi:predicted nucleotidyltransferase
VDTVDLESRIAGFFAARAADEGVVCVYLFGSRARHSERASSDVDVAVLLSHDPPRTLEGLGLDLAADLEHHLGKPVDLIIMNRAPVDLVHRILRDGRLIVERDRSARIRFVVRARNAWFDLKPILDEYRRTGRHAG